MMMEEIGNVNEWEFYAEGGGHLLLQHDYKSCDMGINRNGAQDSVLNKKILRIPKFHDHKRKCQNLEIVIDPEYYCIQSHLFLNNNMKLWFGSRFVTESNLVRLHEQFIHEIAKKVDSKRPLGRRKKPLKLFPMGYLENNIFSFSENHSCPVFGWEIKLKSGLCSLSTFLEEKSFPKLFYNKYFLTQFYKEATANKSETHLLEWGEFLSKSDYQPRHLCSENFPLIQQTIEKLIRNPQNNLGIFSSNIRCYGWDMNKIELYNEALSQFFLSVSPSHHSDDVMQLQNFMNKIYSSIIFAENNFFQSIERMQTLDFMDAEGIGLIYEKGKEFFPIEREGDRDYHSSILEYFSLPVEDSIERLSSLLYQYHSDPLPPPGSSRDLSFLVSSTIRELVSLCLDHHPRYVCSDTSTASSVSSDNLFFETRSMLREKSLSLVSALTLEEVLFLLKLWMLAAIAKDCSIMIAVRPARSADPRERMAALLLQASSSNDSGPFKVSLFKSCGEYGKIFLSHQAEDSDCYWEYKIHLIDIGLKDFSKFTAKAEKDRLICEIFSSQQKTPHDHDLRGPDLS